MDLYLTPDDPENTTMMSANGVAHFRATTTKSSEGTITYLQRPSETLEAGLIAEIHSKKGKKTTIAKSTLLGVIAPDVDDGQGVDASKFLYRKGRFNASRYFMGDDGAEYRWKYQKKIGWTMTKCSSGDEITQQVRWSSGEGMFVGQKKCALRIYPCTIDIELIVLSFLVVEKKRRESKGDERETVHVVVDDPIDGGASGAEEGGSATYGEM
ncbi:TonB box-containing protein [Macrolepiota fuliginosa MF-IS2]|uniref:TonB box-containing protein n=1 Tax=Macrolepiota fuliginosa MF-IS2 TaxID=1400762 RepID=A0A9P6C2H2_9AGAR|nr:TonB box-containing protein [Macrolepiota fuliginosa MF-IS2]